MNYRPRLALFLWAMAALASATRAQDFYWNTAGSRSQALGGVYVPSSSDVLGALAANPAGLTELRSRNLNLETDAVFARGSFSDSVNNDAPLQNSAARSPYGAFGMPIGHSRFSFGVGMTPEFLSTADWRYVDAPGTAGATYGMQDQKSVIWALRFSTGVGVSLGSRVSVGATIGADYNENTLHAPYIFQSQPVLAGLKTLLDLQTKGVGWNGSVGVLAKPRYRVLMQEAQPTKKVEVGVAWKSRTSSTALALRPAMLMHSLPHSALLPLPILLTLRKCRRYRRNPCLPTLPGRLILAGSWPSKRTGSIGRKPSLLCRSH